MKKLKPLIALLLVFGAGLIVGVVGTRVVTRIVIRRALTHPEIVRNRIERELVRKLKLDATQEAKVHDILVDSQKQLRDLRQGISAATCAHPQPRLLRHLPGSHPRTTRTLREDKGRKPALVATARTCSGRTTLNRCKFHQPAQPLVPTLFSHHQDKIRLLNAK